MFGQGPAFAWAIRGKIEMARTFCTNAFMQANRHLNVMLQEREPIERVLMDGNQLAARLQKTMRELTGNDSITVTLNVEKVNEQQRRTA